MLVSLENIKVYLALDTTTYDDLLTLLEESSEAFVESYCNNKLATTDITEYFDGTDSQIDDIFFINNNINVSDLLFYEYDGTTWNLVDSDDYTFDDKGGYLYYDKSALAGNRNYKASYTCGYTTGIPNDLRLAILKLVGKYYNKHKSDGISEEALDGAKVIFEKFLSDDIKIILDKYKLTVI